MSVDYSRRIVLGLNSGNNNGSYELSRFFDPIRDIPFENLVEQLASESENFLRHLDSLLARDCSGKTSCHALFKKVAQQTGRSTWTPRFLALNLTLGHQKDKGPRSTSGARHSNAIWSFVFRDYIAL